MRDLAMVIGVALLGCGDPGSSGVLDADCSPRRAILSSGWLGCAPEDITVSDCRILAAGGGDVAWRASCEGRTVWCSELAGDEATVRCASASDAGE